MSQIIEAHPGARRALFAKYHIGGCSKCAFSPEETLAELCLRNENIPPQEMVEHLLASAEHDLALQITPQALAAALAGPNPPRLIDVRTREEHEAVKIANSEFLSQDLMQAAFHAWPKDTAIVLYCHTGSTGLDLASYFRGHGLNDTHCLAGGIDRWSREVDPAVQRYRLESVD